MSSNRYQLHRPEEVSGGVSKRGLDIAVHDANTEKSRSTRTMSGGEGFQASLALALGLSDVVQQNSGGIRLDAIFIDEGFGTLDDETLNTALETLYSLTNEMRAVGLISHTEQVKNPDHSWLRCRSHTDRIAYSLPHRGTLGQLDESHPAKICAHKNASDQPRARLWREAFATSEGTPIRNGMVATQIDETKIFYRLDLGKAAGSELFP
jgi:hypothetical protein